MREHGRVDRVELRLVQVGFDDPFLQVAPCVRLVVASIGSETGGNDEVRKWQDTDK